MKKKLLFIMDTLPLGGISKSLLALFNELGDESEIDLLLLKQTGLFIPLIPSNVKLLDEPIADNFRNPNPQRAFENMKSLSFKDFMKWLGYSFYSSYGRIIGGLHRQVQNMDKWLGKNIAPLPKQYDAAIAYQGGRCIYYLIEGVNAKIKIGYVHNDYNASEVDFMLYDTDKEYFPKLDYIVTISPKCAKSLKLRFPKLTDKIKVIENICSTKMIRSLSLKHEDLDPDFTGVKLITMGRFDINQKGIDYIAETCSFLKRDGLNFRWYFLGDGAERPKVEKLISDFNVEDNLILLGAKTNPYPYIRQADIYVQPSRFEGKSVALDEVKALAKPIIVTNFSTVHDQFKDNETALICEMNPQSIASTIKSAICDNMLRSKLSENLSNEKVGNEEQAKIFKSLIK